MNTANDLAVFFCISVIFYFVTALFIKLTFTLYRFLIGF